MMYTQAGRYHWMLQYYMRDAGVALVGGHRPLALVVAAVSGGRRRGGDDEQRSHR